MVAEFIINRREEILRAAGRHGAKNVRVFGSAARGDYHAESDVDFLVELEPGRSLLDHATLTLALEDILKKKVDVVTEKGLREGIRAQILREAVVL